MIDLEFLIWWNEQNRTILPLRYVLQRDWQSGWTSTFESKAVTLGSHLHHRIIETLSWKKPIRIVESNSLFLAGRPKTKPYKYDCHPGVPWTLIGLVPSGCLRSGLPAVMIKGYCVNNSLVLIRKMSQQMVDKGLLALVHIQAQVTQDDWFDVGQVLLWMGGLITPF